MRKTKLGKNEEFKVPKNRKSLIFFIFRGSSKWLAIRMLRINHFGTRRKDYKNIKV